MFRVSVGLVAAFLIVGCSSPAPTIEPPPSPITIRTADDALAAGVAYLLKQQSEDGAWRSDVYATLKDGTALTPFVVTALQEADASGLAEGSALPVIAARRKGSEYLAKFAQTNGMVDPGPDGFEYPVYTAALSIRALSHPANTDLLKARDAWVKYLKERQLTEKLGWTPDDKQYGGWGYCRVIPKKPKPNVISPPLIESNLSATLFALDALRAAGETDPEMYKAAATFVRRCQNADGGFHFIYDDPVRNKAGVAKGDPPTFHSYGSTTADGFRALRLCGLAEDEARERAAADWLSNQFRADTHPGTYVKAHELNREAVYYYYVASVSRAFRDQQPKLPDGRNWAKELGTELAKRQHKDGRWVNPVDLVRENDPIVATANAVSALANCRR
jgi:hypothetical protein